MKKLFTLLIPVLLAVLGATVWAAQDLVIVNGEHWVDSSHEQKRAYLFGIGNVLEIEQAMAGEDYASLQGRSIVPVLLDGLSGMSIAELVTQLDRYYADHPDQVNRPVLEVLYIEMALPRMGS